MGEHTPVAYTAMMSTDGLVSVAKRAELVEGLLLLIFKEINGGWREGEETEKAVQKEFARVKGAYRIESDS